MRTLHRDNLMMVVSAPLDLYRPNIRPANVRPFFIVTEWLQGKWGKWGHSGFSEKPECPHFFLGYFPTIASV
jgi:hypothetical protein